MIIIKIVKKELSFRVCSLGVFACEVLIQRQDDLAEIDCIWVPYFETSGYCGELIAE